MISAASLDFIKLRLGDGKGSEAFTPYAGVQFFRYWYGDGFYNAAVQVVYPLDAAVSEYFYRPAAETPAVQIYFVEIYDGHVVRLVFHKELDVFKSCHGNTWPF